MDIGLVYKDGVFIPCNQTMAEEIENAFKEGNFYAFKMIKYSDKRKRTLLQNASLHLYFTKLAKALNDAGLDMKKTLKPETDIPWSDYLVKEFLWKGIQKAMTGKESTCDLETDEVSKIYETLSRHLSTKLGVSLPFPDRHSQSMEDL